MLVTALWTSGDYVSKGEVIGQHLWSPYYRVDYDARYSKMISVNLIGHQIMVSRDDRTRPSFAYALPHLLRRDSGGAPFGDVLIIGAGSGNDVSRALAWGARHIDAVEIDPTIQRIGQTDHPDHPYNDPRVTVHIADGRNFLRTTTATYDLVVFALIDSLVLHTGYSNIRLESFMFTQEAFADVHKRLKPGGLFVVSNYFREGWIVSRLKQAAQAAFGRPPIVLTLPYVATIEPDSADGLTMLLAGGTAEIEAAFGRTPTYGLSPDQPPSPASPDGFAAEPAGSPPASSIRIGQTVVHDPDRLRPATDDWPFLYLRSPMVPALSGRGMAIMAALALALFALGQRLGGHREVRPSWGLNGRMFFLGAGFMLVETKAVVHMALLFGSTWMVNTIVFAGVLVMILAANLFVSRVRPTSVAPYYAGLFALLVLNLLVPLDLLLGLSRPLQILGSCGLALTPIICAGVIFAVSFKDSTQPDRDFGANVAGAMVGGLAENASMLLGFRYLTLVVIAFYALSAWRRAPSGLGRPATSKSL